MITESIQNGGFSPLIVVSLLIVLMLFMTELMSNVALVAVLAPVVAGIAIGLNIPILNVLIPVTMASGVAICNPSGTVTPYSEPYLIIVDEFGHVNVYSNGQGSI